MNEPKSPQKPTKEERLAAKLRENLRRRKAQARAVSAIGEGAGGAAGGAGEAPESSGRKPPLAKPSPES